MLALAQHPKRWTGLSTDTKPELADFPSIGAAAAIPDGSTFLELDTGNIYRWGKDAADNYAWKLDEIKVRAALDEQTAALLDLRHAYSVRIKEQRKFFQAKARFLYELERGFVGELLSQDDPVFDPLPQPAASSSLLNGLLGGWALEEASGDRADVLGVYPLTPTNTPGNAAGKVGNAVALDGTQYLLTAGNFIGSRPANFTFACWAYPTVSGAFLMMMSTGLGWFELRMDIAGTAWQWVDGLDVVSLAGGTVALNTWQLLIGWWDGTTRRISKNDGTAAENAAALQVYVAAKLGIGVRPPSTLPMTGRIDEAYVWDRVLTASERTSLYNGGAGRTYPFAGG